MANQNSTHSIITFILFAALCVVGYLWYTGGSGNDQQSASGKTHGLLETETEFRDKLAELRMQKYKVENGIERLENLKSETVEHLNAKGINSLDKIERDRIDESVSLSKDEYKELQKIILDLNERLSVETDMLEEEELGKLLDLEMTGTKK
jgi:hypothetical protein